MIKHDIVLAAASFWILEYQFVLHPGNTRMLSEKVIFFCLNRRPFYLNTYDTDKNFDFGFQFLC